MLFILPDEYLRHHVLPLLCLKDLVNIDSAARGSRVAECINIVFENHVMEEDLRLNVACLGWLSKYHVYGKRICVPRSIPSQYSGIFAHTVSLDVTQISSADIQSIIPHCNRLQYFGSNYFCDKNISDLLMQHCRSLQGLRLNLLMDHDAATLWQPEVLIDLSRAFPNMSKLELPSGGHFITDKILRQVCMNCRRLTELDLQYCNSLGDAAIRDIAQYCPLIQKLILSNVDAITDEGTCELFLALPELRYVNVSGCTRLTSAAVSSLARGCPKLTHVNLAEIDDDNTCVSSLLKLIGNCRLLTEVNFACLGNAVNDGVLNALADNCPHLKIVSFSTCGQITDAGFMSFVSKFTDLIEIDVSDCALTDKALCMLASLCPKLRTLWCLGLNIDCKTVISIVRSCPLLRLLDIRYCYPLSEEDRKAIREEATLYNTVLGLVDSE